jgi:hypothetical protein
LQELELEGQNISYDALREKLDILYGVGADYKGIDIGL